MGTNNTKAARLTAPAPHHSQGIVVGSVSQTKNCKVQLEKFHTPESLANHCWDKAYEALVAENISESVEPSVGGGAFRYHLDYCAIPEIR